MLLLNQFQQNLLTANALLSREYLTDQPSSHIQQFLRGLPLFEVRFKRMNF